MTRRRGSSCYIRSDSKNSFPWLRFSIFTEAKFVFDLDASAFPAERAHSPLVRGNLQLWKEILSQKTNAKAIHGWGKRSDHLDRPEQLLEAMFTFSRVDTDSGPLQMYLLFSELDSRRSPEQRLSADTLRLMASRYDQFSDQYLTFPEFPELNDASITHFLDRKSVV